MDATEVNKGLKTFITENLLDGEGDDLEDHTPLLELGIIDSMAMVSLLTFIQKKLGVSIPDDKVSPRHFQSINSLQKLILETQAAAD